MVGEKMSHLVVIKISLACHKARFLPKQCSLQQHSSRDAAPQQRQHLRGTQRNSVGIG